MMKRALRLRTLLPRHILGVMGVVVVLAGSGVVAYACGVGGNGCGGIHDGKDCQPPGGIYWVSYAPPVGSAANVACTISISTSTLLVEGASKLLPGQSCSFSAELKNTETQTVALSEVVTGPHPTSCSTLFGYSDNVPSAPPHTVLSGQNFPYKSTVSLSIKASNPCEGTSATFTIVIFATPYAKCW